MKRLLDLTCSLIALAILAPLLVVVILVLRLTGEGEVFYVQTRIGRKGTPFGIVKFATMLKESPNMSGGDITGTNDPRVLPVGRFLRKSKINELPQLWNVVVGDMSLIGPRPITSRQYDMFPESYRSAVAHVRPGLSGLGSIIFRDEEKLFGEAEDRDRVYKEVVLPYKSALEEWYVRNQSFWLDIKLLCLTVVAVLAPAFRPDKHFEGLPSPPATMLI